MEWILTNIIIPGVIGLVIGAFIGLIIGTILFLKGYRLKQEEPKNRVHFYVAIDKDGELYFYPTKPIRRGDYIGDVKYRKEISKRLRRLGLNEAKTYTLVSPDMAKLFDYEHKEKVILPNPMSIDKSIIRTSILPSLLNIYEYNKARKVEDVLIYEISKTYDLNYTEDTKVCVLMKGHYINDNWNNSNIRVSLFIIAVN